MSDPVYRIRVVGDPQPQGSKRAFPNPQNPKRPIIVDDNPKPLKLWRTAVAQACQAALADGTLERLPGVCRVRIEFVLPPVASDPDRVLVEVMPDIDKLLRSTLDGLKAGRAIVDDARIAESWQRKRYAVGDEPTGAIITLVDLAASEKAARSARRAARKAAL